jgi:hypothetical protein
MKGEPIEIILLTDGQKSGKEQQTGEERSDSLQILVVKIDFITTTTCGGGMQVLFWRIV